jgi:hypothetical protein
MSKNSCTPEESAGRCEYLTLAFSPISRPLRSRWRNNGLSADFLGDYVTTFLPSEEPVSTFESRQKAIKHAVSFVANELLENAMKYHQRDVDIPIRMHLELSSDQVTVSVSNGVSASQAEIYETFVTRLREGNADELLIQQQELSALNSEASISSVGLLTMVSDYDAQLDWRFEAHGAVPGCVTVTTVAILPLRNVPGASA